MEVPVGSEPKPRANYSTQMRRPAAGEKNSFHHGVFWGKKQRRSQGTIQHTATWAEAGSITSRRAKGAHLGTTDASRT
jgi:hypothetical protein